MSLLQSVIMGIVQGLTEFLPVSSSGHLVLAGSLLGIKTNTGIVFELMLHMGTLISIVVVFYKDILQMITEFFAMGHDIFKGRGLGLKNRPHRVMLVMVLAATIPTGLIGILFKDFFQRAFSSIRLVSVMLLITGALLYIANKMQDGVKGPSQIKLSDALIIGIFQGLAVTPGISRSGSTIFAGLTRGFTRELATRFSFIMSIPAILGAAVLELLEYYGSAAASTQELTIMLVGMFAAAVAGTLAIRLLIEMLKKGKLNYFSYYCWFLGGTSFVASFFIN